MSLLIGEGAVSTRGGYFRGSYANPHTTIAIRDIPTDIRQVMRLCRFYYHQDALLGAIVEKMSEYPITDLVIEDADDARVPLSTKDRKRWDQLVDTSMDLRSTLRNINIDKYVFGVSVHYLHLPFVRYCRPLGETEDGKDIPIKSFAEIKARVQQIPGSVTDVEMHILGRRTGETGFKEYTVVDRRSRARRGCRLTRLNPLRLSTQYEPTSGAQAWFLMPDPVIRHGIENNTRVVIENADMRFIAGAVLNRNIQLNPDRLWVAKAPESPGIWEGWGVPPLFRVLEDTYYYKILRRANEALAQEHVTPFRILSPGVAGDVSALRSLNLADWQTRIKSELNNFRRDPNHIMVSPIPLNVEQMGGQARVMMVAAEMEAAARNIAMGLGCPLELVMGGLNWSGASVSLRVLENHFLNDRQNSQRLLDYIEPKLATHFNLPRIKLRLSDFKMADDAQMLANKINLMVQGFLDRGSVLPEIGHDPDQVFESLKTEHQRLNEITTQDNIASANLNVIIQRLQSHGEILLKYELQLLEQQAAAKADRARVADIAALATDLRNKGYATPVEFEHSVRMLQAMNPAVRDAVLAQWSQSMPLVSQLLMEKSRLNGLASGAPPATGPDAMQMNQPMAGPQDPYGGATGQPVENPDELPEQRPPRGPSQM
jgi:hypothetical protein